MLNGDQSVENMVLPDDDLINDGDMQAEQESQNINYDPEV